MDVKSYPYRRTFWINQLVNDMTSLPIMRKIGYPICFDATHSIQLPTQWVIFPAGKENSSLPSESGLCLWVNAIFMEVHDNPEKHQMQILY